MTPAAGPVDRSAVCVLGLGLIGGSLLRALSRAGRPAYGYNRSPGAVAQARADGFDVTDDLPAALARATGDDALIVVATPMPAVEAMFAAIAVHASGCAVTDVVSVKAPVRVAAARHGLAHRFIGGHPMAGTAHSGWSAGTATLFDDAVWVIATDDDADNPGSFDLSAADLADVELDVVVLPPQEHEFTCVSCFLVKDRLQFDHETKLGPICQECAS